jgi:hypothetical protein
MDKNAANRKGIKKALAKYSAPNRRKAASTTLINEVRSALNFIE